MFLDEKMSITKFHLAKVGEFELDELHIEYISIPFAGYFYIRDTDNICCEECFHKNERLKINISIRTFYYLYYTLANEFIAFIFPLSE